MPATFYRLVALRRVRAYECDTIMGADVDDDGQPVFCCPCDAGHLADPQSVENGLLQQYRGWRASEIYYGRHDQQLIEDALHDVTKVWTKAGLFLTAQFP